MVMLLVKVFIMVSAWVTTAEGAPKGVRKRLREPSSDVAEEGGGPSSSTTAIPERTRASLRQRLRASPSTHQQNPGTPLIDSLKRDWAAGHLSARQVQEYAAGAEAQGAGGLERMARAGAHGERPSNIQRTLLSLFGKPAGAPNIDWVEIPTSTSPRAPHPVIWPHKMFQSLFHNRKDWWGRYMTGPVGQTLEYWQSVKHLDFVTKHPALPERAWPSTIPIGMHGDAGAFNKQESLLVLSWNSLLGHGITRRKRFVFTFVKKSECTPETISFLMRMFAWSVNAMLSGKEPLRDWCDRPWSRTEEELASGWKACLCQIRGDWQWYCELFAFPNWNGAERMCWMCLASASVAAFVFKKCGPAAGWRATEITHEDYVANIAATGATLPALFQYVIGLRLECVTIDALHALDLGEAAHIIGDVMWDTIRLHSWGGRNQDDNAKLLTADLRKWEKKHNSKTRLQGDITVSRLKTKSGNIKLKAKGAPTRHLATYALALSKRFSTGTEYDRTKIAICQCLVKVYDIMATGSMFLSPAALDAFRQAGQQMVLLHSKLHADCFSLGERRWKFPPKAHLIDHLVTIQAPRWGNPSYCWCYGDEDLVGLVIDCAQSCHSKTCATVALIKWLVIAFDREQALQ